MNTTHIHDLWLPLMTTTGDCHSWSPLMIATHDHHMWFWFMIAIQDNDSWSLLMIAMHDCHSWYGGVCRMITFSNRSIFLPFSCRSQKNWISYHDDSDWGQWYQSRWQHSYIEGKVSKEKGEVPYFTPKKVCITLYLDSGHFITYISQDNINILHSPCAHPGSPASPPTHHSPPACHSPLTCCSPSTFLNSPALSSSPSHLVYAWGISYAPIRTWMNWCNLYAIIWHWWDSHLPMGQLQC